MAAIFQSMRAGVLVSMSEAPPVATTEVTSSLALVYSVAVSATASFVLAYTVAQPQAPATEVAASLAVAYTVEQPQVVPGVVLTALALSYVVIGTYSQVSAGFPLSYAVAGVAPPAIGTPGPQSLARTYVVTEPQVRPEEGVKGSFWNYANPAKPKGVKDPDSDIDIPFDWTAWLKDATDSYASHSFRATGGIAVVSAYQKDGVVVPSITGGTRGATASLTCRIRTNSNPPRSDERTVYFKIKDL